MLEKHSPAFSGLHNRAGFPDYTGFRVRMLEKLFPDYTTVPDFTIMLEKLFPDYTTVPDFTRMLEKLFPDFTTVPDFTIMLEKLFPDYTTVPDFTRMLEKLFPDYTTVPDFTIMLEKLSPRLYLPEFVRMLVGDIHPTPFGRVVNSRRRHVRCLPPEAMSW